MTVSIRAASVADVDCIVSLNRDVQQLHAELEPSFFKSHINRKDITSFFAEKIAMPEHHFRLAHGEGDPDGYLWFEVQERPETPLTFSRKRIYIHHLSVRTEVRRNGIASALLGHVEAEVLARGIKTIVLDTWAANRSASRFFEGCGFTMLNLTLAKRLM